MRTPSFRVIDFGRTLSQKNWLRVDREKYGRDLNTPEEPSKAEREKFQRYQDIESQETRSEFSYYD